MLTPSRLVLLKSWSYTRFMFPPFDVIKINISITFKKRKRSHLPRYKYRVSTVWHSVNIKWSSRWRWNTREIFSQSGLTKREIKRWFARCALHNLSTFDVIGSKAREIGGEDINLGGWGEPANNSYKKIQLEHNIVKRQTSRPFHYIIKSNKFSSNISNTRDSVSSGYPNTERRVEKTTRSGVIDEIRRVWIADETLSQMFDISFQSKQKLRSKCRWDHSHSKSIFQLAFNGIKSAVLKYITFPWLFFKISIFPDSK